MSKTVVTMGLGCVTLFGALIVGFIYLGSTGPDIAVYTGRQIPKEYMATIRSLGLLEVGEDIRYFYSDALFDIETGFYFVTTDHLVLYSSAWEEPATIIPLDQIEDVEAEFVDSIWEDSFIYVTTASGLEVSFPVSSEQGGDKRFMQALEQSLAVE